MKSFRIVLAFGILVTAMSSMALAHLPQSTPKAANLNGLHDFDFLVGEWRVHHRVKRPADNDQWLEFDGTCSNRALMGGSSNVEATCCPIVELRQYTLHPGQRDVLIDLFDREFIETQEAEGMRIIGQFRDLDNPNRFVWLRGFSDMPERARALAAFYGGPAWKAHSKAANATMVDASNVLLLRPSRSISGFSLEKLQRPAPGSTDVPKRLVIGTVYYFDQSPSNDFIEFFEREVAPLLRDAGASIIARFVTENSPNTFPALPVREGEHVFVFFSSFRDVAAYEHYVAELGRSRRWNGGTLKALLTRIKRPPEILRLSPTARSLVGR